MEVGEAGASQGWAHPAPDSASEVAQGLASETGSGDCWQGSSCLLTASYLRRQRVPDGIPGL